MSVLVALTVGLVLWIVGWALGVKPFDAFLVTLALVLAAAAWRIVSPYVNQLMGRETAAEQQTPTGV